MSKITPKLLDVVALTVNLPEYKLLCGQVGTIVELLADGTVFEVESLLKQSCKLENTIL